MNRAIGSHAMPMLAAAALLAALLFALLARLPDGAALSDAGALRQSTTLLAWAAAEPEPAAGPPLPHARAELEQRFDQLLADLRRTDLDVPALADFGQVLKALPAQPSRDATRHLAALASRVTDGVRQANDARRDRLALWLEGLVVALALILGLPLLDLWRQRRHLRAALQRFGRQLGQGDWREAVQALRVDNRGAAGAFDALAGAVEGVLGDSERRWQALAELTDDGYWQTDSAQRLTRICAAAPEIFVLGWPPSELIGRRRSELAFAEPPAEGWSALEQRCDRREAFRDVEFRLHAAHGGTFIWVSISGRPRFDEHGEFVGHEGVARDITERKVAHERLAERTRELERLNLDHEAFSRELAHELRTPIGHIEGLAGLVEQRAAGRLDDEDRELLRLQMQSAHSMRRTLDALLQLARSGVQALPLATVDISALAAQTVTLPPLIERRAEVDWQIEPGLRALGSAAALQIVLSNLLGNAAKFTRHVAQPVVSVSGRRDADGRLRVVIQDNGAGFEPAQAGRLFAPFSRLHSGDEFHGTGIGLSIVQRIVERHGGTVAAHGERGRGARFEFTLPAG